MKGKQTNTGRTHFKKGYTSWNKGLPAPWVKNNPQIFTREKTAGEKHWNWKGGITNKIIKIRRSFEYKQWVKQILEKDDYRCMDCGQRGGELEADHIYSFAEYPRLRFEIHNGQTLCKNCHRIKTSLLMKNNKFAIGIKSAIN